MRRLRAWFLRLGSLFHKGRRDRELAEELEVTSRCTSRTTFAPA